MNSLASNTKVTLTNKGLLILHDKMPDDAIREPVPEHVGFVLMLATS